jgi:hypothetical protein
MRFEGAIMSSIKQTICSPFILMIVMSGNQSTSVEALCQLGMDLLTEGSPADAAEAFRSAIAKGELQAGAMSTAHIEAHHGLIRALRDAGRLEQSIGAALALTALTPGDPLAHTALSISLQQAGHIPQAEAAAAKARVLEWKIQLLSPPDSQP